MPTNHPALPLLLQTSRPDPQALAAEAAAGLLAQAAALPPKFFYDRLGSRLFDAITALPEYYPTRTEAGILQAHGAAIAAAVQARTGPGMTIVDLGAGDGEKAASLFPLLQPATYLAVDISVDHLGAALERLQQRHPDIAMRGLGLDFSARLALPAAAHPGTSPALVFYPGSSIGNFAPEAALRLLREAHAAAAGGALLIGVDLVKPAALLEAAYDDALGVTAAFNLNLLRHLNQVLGSNFDVRQWRHRAHFDTSASRVQMHLQAREALTVRWPDAGSPGGFAQRSFAAGETIHTEDAWKWRPDDFSALLHDAGWQRVQVWTDPQRWFAVMVALA